MPTQCPSHVTAHQRFVIIERTYQRRQSFGTLDIAQGHSDIAQQSAPLGPQNGTAMKTNAKSFLVERQQRNELRRMQAGFRLIGLIRSRLGLDIVRTDFLTDVAAENMVAD